MPDGSTMAWNKPLAYELPLKDGRILRTLHDARYVFASGVFDGVTHSPPLEHALDLLLKAAETGTPDDVKAATDQIGVVLRLWKMAS
jgi:hypothetical protein